MNSETRTLIVIMIVVGFFACCCLCVPVGLFVLSPAITQVQKAVVRAEAQRAANERARAQGAIAPPNFPAAPSGVRVPSPPGTPVRPPLPPSPPWGSQTNRVGPAPGTAPTGEVPAGGGLASLSEQKRKSIYRSATLSARVKESLERSEAQLRARGIDTATLQQRIADQEARIERDLERLAERSGLSQDDLKTLIEEGRANNW